MLSLILVLRHCSPYRGRTAIVFHLNSWPPSIQPAPQGQGTLSLAWLIPGGLWAAADLESLEDLLTGSNILLSDMPNKSCLNSLTFCAIFYVLSGCYMPHKTQEVIKVKMRN